MGDIDRMDSPLERADMIGGGWLGSEDQEPYETADDVEASVSLDDILMHEGNLCDLIPEDEVTKIGSRVVRDAQTDEDSRKDWLDRYQRWLDMAMQVREEKSFPWPKAANFKFPLLTTASIQFQARAYPIIVDGVNLVKARVLADDPDGQKRERADRIAQHMTWQLLYRVPGWEEETDRLLLILPIAGCVFRKTYHDALLGQSVSEMVTADNLIVNYSAKSLATAPRFTHVLRYYRHEIAGKIKAGVWRDIKVRPDGDDGDEDALIELYEQHRYEDLDDDGVAEPYVVTCSKDGQVARIARCFGDEDITVATDQGLETLDKVKQGAEIKAVVRIARRQYFSKYSFIPAPDGSFYDIGFGWLLEDIGEGVNSTINRMLDAGALQNAGGGWLATTVQHRGGNMTFRLGEWKRVEVTGQTSLRDSIFRMDHPGPSPVLFSLLQMLIGAAKEITSVQDILTGAQQPSNTPATTTLAQIEQGTKVFSAIVKRVHRAFGEDLRMLQRLNRDHLDQDEYFALLDDDKAAQVGKADYEDRDLDVIPVSDPNMASDMQRMARAQALMQFNGDVLINQEEIRRRFLTAIGERDVKALMTVPEPPPNPALLMAQMKEARDKEIDAAKVRNSDADAADKLMSAADKAAALGLVRDAAAFAGAAEHLGGETNDDGQPAEPAAGQGGLGGMAAQPDDGGVPGLPGGQAAPVDGGMGQGDADVGGGPSPGGDVGPPLPNQA